MRAITRSPARRVFTISPKPRALSCGADVPGNLSLYAISVRRLIALRSNFLQTLPHGFTLLSARIYGSLFTTVRSLHTGGTPLDHARTGRAQARTSDAEQHSAVFYYHLPVG